MKPSDWDATNKWLPITTRKRLDRIESILAMVAGITPVIPAPMGEIDNLRAQNQRYRTALIECAREAGSVSPPQAGQPIEHWTVQSVRSLRTKFELAGGGK